ncbi:ROK family protein [Candidatus Poriferisodalis sp.]|uniref:ROK family protein n=1 Tax=Candidatus Poriferisodalis sp. TaxID=3101277 RepID=UPI003AF67AB8
MTDDLGVRGESRVGDASDFGSSRTFAGNSSLQIGIDVGGTSIKGAVVDVAAGELSGPVLTEATPPTATPHDVMAAIGRITSAVGWSGPVGVALPGVVDGLSLRHAPNLGGSWEDADALSCLRAASGANAVLINDADAAGLAELRYGEATLRATGLAIVLTFGTGVGSALLHNGSLIPNSELGGLIVGGACFEEVASGRAISTDGLTPSQWAERAQPFFEMIETMLHPSCWVVGGGLSNEFDRFVSELDLSKPITVAHRGMHAGIVGAAVAAMVGIEAEGALGIVEGLRGDGNGDGANMPITQ